MTHRMCVNNQRGTWSVGVVSGGNPGSLMLVWGIWGILDVVSLPHRSWKHPHLFCHFPALSCCTFRSWLQHAAWCFLNLAFFYWPTQRTRFLHLKARICDETCFRSLAEQSWTSDSVLTCVIVLTRTLIVQSFTVNEIKSSWCLNTSFSLDILAFIWLLT